jgi:hypothetical protein
MKKYKQFRAEQQYITEVGPFASAMMVAMGAAGLGFAGFKLFKTAKEKIKGYKETKAEKKDNQENGVFVQIKKWDEKKGKIITQSVEIAAAGSSEANMSNEDIEKKKKELQKKEDPKNNRMQAAYDEKERVTGDEKDAAASASKGVKDWMGADVGEIPDGMKPKVREKERLDVKGHKDVLAYMDRWSVDSVKGWVKKTDPDDPDDFEYIDQATAKKEAQAKKAQQAKNATLKDKLKGRAKEREGGKNISKQSLEHLLTFGEYISEGVMSDLLKATKSKKDSEITLDDGADIPIDPLTSQILVKYIEGLSSSEKNRTIQQIQRTERAFMKVLGKAHEG